ncbi:MAG TPA: hypothetical protein VGC42_09340 [Kofleriaceae bacterium]
MFAVLGVRAGVARAEPCDPAPIDLAIWSSISLNARHERCVANALGLALGAGRADEVDGLQLGVIGQTASRRLRGVQLGGGYAIAGDTTGLQLAIGFAAAAGELTGGQLALITTAGQATRGLQLAGLVAASGDDDDGLQLAGLLAASGEAFHGLQAAAGLAATGSRVRGLQAAGALAAAGDDFTGLQLGGLVAAAGEAFHGVQAAGALAAAHELTGVQLALVNVGGVVHGAQLGLVNIADRVHGVQLGLVNISRHATAPLGLVSYVGDGERAVELWGGEAVPVAAAARFGTAHVYSLLGLAGDPVHARHTWGPLGGVGVAAGPLELDALGHGLIHAGVEPEAVLAQLRLRLRLPLTDQLSLAAGPTWNVYVSRDDDGAALPLGLDTAARHGATTVRQWPGVTAGAMITY